MRVLVPDLPAFRALGPAGKYFVPGAELAFYSEGDVPAGEAQGVVLWKANAETRAAVLQTPRLEWALTLSSGTDHLRGQVPHGVRLFNAATLHERSVALHVVAGLLSAVRGFHRFRDAQARGEWVGTSTPNPDLGTLEGQKVVLWGYGHIGRQVERMLHPFGASVYHLTSRTEPDLVDYRLSEADWVVMLMPSTAKTRGILNAERLATLKRGVWISNQGRGDLIVTADLLDALDSGQVGGAVLDVTDPEPLPAEHGLWQRPNVILTPHTAGVTADLLERSAAFTRSFVLDRLQGREAENEVAAGDT